MNGIELKQRIWKPDPQLLAVLDPNTGTSGTQVVGFEVPTPDARTQVKAAVVIGPVNAPGIAMPYDVTRSGGLIFRLWLAGCERHTSGMLIPVTNLLGTRAAPAVIPPDVNVMGYSRTYLDIGDTIWGELSIETVTPAAESFTADIKLHTRYQPVAGAVLCDDEWRAIVAQCNPRLIGAALFVEGGE